jgi:hypothetical protein
MNINMVSKSGNVGLWAHSDALRQRSSSVAFGMIVLQNSR